MYNTNISLSIKLLSVFLCACFSAIFTLSASAEENYGNISPDPNMMGMSEMGSVDLPFDPNDYAFLIYDSNGNEDSIEDAMQHLGISYDRRGPGESHEVTANDLATHDILIVGWNVSGDTSGLDPNTLAGGITGRVILSGHDLDYHTVFEETPEYQQAAETMLIQSIDYVLQGSGTGLITLGCTNAFPYLPEEWGVNATASGGEDVNSFTEEGLSSGIFDNLEPNNFDNWGTSYHNIFTIEQDSDFVEFELGGDGDDIITVAKIYSSHGVLLIKTDDIGNCAEPYDESYSTFGLDIGIINYTIDYNMAGYSDSNIYIVDTLPDDVNYFSSEPNGSYDPNTSTITWGPYNLDGNDTDTITVTVEVLESAVPGSTITNLVEMHGDTFYISDTVDTNICCYGPTIVYVDDDANPNGDGQTWQTAFNDLQYAIDFAASQTCYNTIYVAAGTYQPVNDINIPGYENYSFELADGVALFGHFDPNDPNQKEPSDRDLSNPANTTILQGEIPAGDDISKLVTANSITGTLLDGFTITGAASYGIELTGDCNVLLTNCIISNSVRKGINISGTSSIHLHNCSVSDSGIHGIYSVDSVNVTLTDCTFSSNDDHIYLDSDNPKTITAVSCLFDGNDITSKGIYTQKNTIISLSDCNFTGHTSKAVETSRSTLTMSDCSIDDSATDSDDYGIHLSDGSAATILNCSIDNVDSSRSDEGIYCGSCSNVTIEDTSITNWGYDGIYSTASDNTCNLNVSRCRIAGNGDCGIEARNTGNRVIIDKCIIADNSDKGISVDNTRSADITNCFIYGNDIGIDFDNNAYVHNASNNSIIYNNEHGIQSCSTALSITNCIIWNPDGDDLYNCSATYSCIYDNDAGTGNIFGDANAPSFYDIYNNDYHLTGNSPCIDAGTGSYPDETDFDGEDRVMDGDANGTEIVDIGADEYYWPQADYNTDEIVNFLDYSFLAQNWLDINSAISLDDDNDVDTYDLDSFCVDWLWQAPWGNNFLFMRMAGGGGHMLTKSLTADYSIAVSPRTSAIGLMIPDVTTSLESMPDSTYEKVGKFYKADAYEQTYISPWQRAALIADMLDWLDELWESGEVGDMTYEGYIEFREAIKSSFRITLPRGRN